MYTWIAAILLIFVTTITTIGMATESISVSVPSSISEISDNEHTKGNPEADVQIIVYADYLCGGCGITELILSNLMQEFGNHVYLSYRHFPLPGHENSIPGVRAAEAAGLQGKFWEMTETLFANQREWGFEEDPKPQFLTYAQQLDLDLDQFEKDYDSEALKEFAEDSQKRALELELDYTPTLILNGEIIDNPRNYEQFEELFRTAISEASA